MMAFGVKRTIWRSLFWCPVFARASVACAAFLTVFGLWAQQQPSPLRIESASVSPITLTSIEQSNDAPAVSEQELRQQFVGKTFYLRSAALGNSLHFDVQGHLGENAQRASYTLSLVEIQRVRVEKRHIQIQAVRYGLHFLGASASEDQNSAIDRVRLTTKKKPLMISIDREQVVKPKKKKEKHEKRGGTQAASSMPAGSSATRQVPAPQLDDQDERRRAETVSQAHANQALAQAFDNVFAAAIDDRMIATLPDYWKLFFQSVAEHRDWRPSDRSILHQGAVDQKAKLVSIIDPPSNEFAQNNGVAGMATYHVVIGADGKPQQISVARPIGFGLDENAVKSIREAKFQPAFKDSRPVPVVLDLLVQFRIYSKRTAVVSNQARSAGPAAPTLPGPYTANAPPPQAAPDPTQQPAAQPDATQQPAGSAPATQQSVQQPEPAAQQPQ